MAVRDGGGSDSPERLYRLLDDAEPRLRDAFLEAVRQMRDTVSVPEIVALIEAGRTAELLAVTEPAAQILAGAYMDVLEISGADTAKFLSEDVLTSRVIFDRAEERVFSVLSQEKNRVIRLFTNEQNRVITEVLQDGFTRGLNPRVQAREIRESLGLTPYQEGIIRNYRAQLTGRADATPSRQVFQRALRDRRFDRTVERAIRDRRPLSAEQIDRMVSRYRERFVAYHAEVVARTEALSAVHQGVELMYQQSSARGDFAGFSLIRTWFTAEDERVRESHRLLHGQERPFGPDQVWQGLHGDLRYPGDPAAPLAETAQCRCVATTRVAAITENS
jgi:hypothetical protein